MNARGIRWAFTLSLLALVSLSPAAWADVPVSPPPSWIYDGANLLKPEELTELTTLREQLEQRSGARLVVLTLASAEGETSKAIAVRTLNQWHAGPRSALLLVLLSPRELYIQPGTELAPLLDASTSSAICSGMIAPKMRSGTRAAAIHAGLEAIADRISSNRSGTTSPAPVAPVVPVAPAKARTITPSPSSGGEIISGWTILGIFGGIMAAIAALWVVLKRVFTWVFDALTRLAARKCTECGEPMSKRSAVLEQPTYSSPGEGMHTFECNACQNSFTETYVIAQLVERTSSSSDSSWSSSSDSSWSSSSDSSSSSSSSSDGSGGGGSSW